MRYRIMRMKLSRVWFLIFLCSARVVSAAADLTISPHRAAPERTVPSFGLLVDHVSGNARRVQLSAGDEESKNSIGLTSKLKKRPVSHFKASVLTLALFSIPLWRHKVGWDLVVVIVVLYLLEILTCSTRRYLSNGLAPAEFRRLIDDFVVAKPEIVWELECYHYRTHGIGKGNSEDKVVTYRASRSFNIER